MRVARRLAIGSAVLLLLASALVLSSSAEPRAARGSGQPVELFAVDALKTTNAWAVGDYFKDPSDYGDYFTTSMHFKNGHWSRVGSPSPTSYKAALFGVDALSATNAWAVGQYNSRNGNDYTLIEHWTGGKWHIVKSPNPGQYGNGFAAVSAVSADDVWAVGYYGPPKTLIARWRGSSWKVVNSQDPAAGKGAGNVLLGVSAAGPANAWAVGYQTLGSSGPTTLIEHWNGNVWQVQQGVDPANASDVELFGVTAIAPNDVWAVGSYTDGAGEHPLLEHYDGNNWSLDPGAAISGQGALAAVSADASSDVWAVGSAGGPANNTLVEHWDGAKWTRVASPSPSKSENDLLGVSARAPGDVWAVGYSTISGGHKSLIEHWNGTSWSVK